MNQNTGVFHGVPMLGTLKSPGRYSPPGNGQPKQPPQQFPPCTTQASPSAATMTDDQARAITNCRTPSLSLSPQMLDTFSPGHIPRTSQSPVLEPGAFQGGGAGTAQEQLMLAGRDLRQGYSPGHLQHRNQGMWPTRRSESQDYDEGRAMLQRRASEEAGRSPPQPAHLSQGNNGYASQSRGSTNSHNMFPPSYPWNYMPTTTQPAVHQSNFYPSDLHASVDVSHANNPSASYYPGMGSPKRYSDDVNFNLMSTVASFPAYTSSAENVPITSLSPSTTLPFYEAPAAMRQDREDTVPLSESEVDSEYKDRGWWPENLLGGSPSSTEAPGGKVVDAPYAQLIYRAFLSRPTKSMTLQELYQWFREHTDKTESDNRGWQNSIRHNLSMNGAFTKRNCRTPLSSNRHGSVSLDTTGVGGRKSTEWFLEPKHYTGVESTTRYRKGNSGSRSRVTKSQKASAKPRPSGLPSNGRLSHARVTAGRKGGNVAAQNRKRLAERQQLAQRMEMVRPARQQRLPRHHMPQLSGHGFGYAGPPPFIVGGGTDGADSYGYHPQAVYGHQLPTSSSFSPPPPPPPPPVFGTARQHELMGYNFFASDDVGRDVDMNRSPTLGTDNGRSEPTTPPGSALDPPRSAVAGSSFGGGSKHREFLPGMGGMGPGSFNPLNVSYQHMLGGMGAHGQHPPPHQQQAYSLADVTGVYDPPAGSHQPPVFMDQDLNLGSGDALLMDLGLME